MNKKRRTDGGPAFPVDEVCELDITVRPRSDGLSIRDWFAGLAMQAMTASPALMEAVTGPDAGAGRHFERLARKAYEQADAMIAAREV